VIAKWRPIGWTLGLGTFSPPILSSPALCAITQSLGSSSSEPGRSAPDSEPEANQETHHDRDTHDKGGNLTQVRFYDRGTNMHRLWDSDMIEREGDDEDFWLADLAALDQPANRAAALRGSVEDWATESLVAARAAYLVPETGKRLKPGQKLSDAYANANMPVVRQRLYQAGIRLAKLLNEAFTETR
jgi:hypothetical protein